MGEWPRTIFSQCGTYRYVLYRRADLLASGPPLLASLINPSTAGAHRDDPTTRLMRRWGHLNGFGDYLCTNPHAVRSSDPRIIDAHPDPVGPHNDAYIARCVGWVRDRGGTVVIGWGNRMATRRVDRLMELLGTPLYCLGRTRTNAPAFPTPFLMRRNPTLELYP